MAKNIDFMGAIFPDVPSVKLPQQGGGLVAFDDTTDATATADKILQGYTAYANGQKLVGTASGGITPSGTISITQNGQVDVTQYATADVNVSGGGGSSYTLLAEQTIVVESASSTATKVATLSCGSDAWTYNNMVYFKIRCTEKINSHFYGYDLFYIRNTDSANITIGNYTGGTYYKFGYAGAMIATKSTTGLGVYPNNLKENGDIDIFTKTNSNASNILGTYHVEVYALKWPNDVSPFDA